MQSFVSRVSACLVLFSFLSVIVLISVKCVVAENSNFLTSVFYYDDHATSNESAHFPSSWHPGSGCIFSLPPESLSSASGAGILLVWLMLCFDFIFSSGVERFVLFL